MFIRALSASRVPADEKRRIVGILVLVLLIYTLLLYPGRGWWLYPLQAGFCVSPVESSCRLISVCFHEERDHRQASGLCVLLQNGQQWQQQNGQQWYLQFISVNNDIIYRVSFMWAVLLLKPFINVVVYLLKLYLMFIYPKLYFCCIFIILFLGQMKD